MGRLSQEQIADEVKQRGYELVDAAGYVNLASRIVVKCPKGHLIETTLGDVRKPSFTCPICDRNVEFKNPNAIPEKKGYRIVAFDQATEKFGLSIFDDGKLVYYTLYTFIGDLNTRLAKAAKLVRDIVIPNFKPDYIIMEDIQYQNNGVITFKILAMLLGILEAICVEADVPFEVVSPNVWRKYAGTCGKTRKEEKALSVAIVKEKYNISVIDDVAEAILIGRYGVRAHPGGLAFGK